MASFAKIFSLAILLIHGNCAEDCHSDDETSLIQTKQSLALGSERSQLNSHKVPRSEGTSSNDDEEAGPLQTLGKALADVFGLGSMGSDSDDGDDTDKLDSSDAMEEKGAAEGDATSEGDELLGKIRKKEVAMGGSEKMFSEEARKSQNEKTIESVISMSRATKKMEAGITMEATRYLDLVRDTITGAQSKTPTVEFYTGNEEKKYAPFNGTDRWRGKTWCDFCFSMAGGARVQNVRELVERTITNGVPGDFLEAGTWRGGNSIMARVVQQVMGEGDKRRTYVCDSFSGLPKRDRKSVV